MYMSKKAPGYIEKRNETSSSYHASMVRVRQRVRCYRSREKQAHLLQRSLLCTAPMVFPSTAKGNITLSIASNLAH